MKINPTKSKKWKKPKMILLTMLILAFVVGLIHLISMLTYDKKLEFKTVEIISEDIANELNGYKIVFITDTHEMKLEELEMVVTTLNNQGGNNLLILGGDYGLDRYRKNNFEYLSRINTTDGKYAVEGNHDNVKKVVPELKALGVDFLANEGLYIRDSFYLAGTEDLWVGEPDIQKSVETAKTEDFVLLVSHNPDTTMEQSMEKVDLTISGHTHGGQISFFGIYSPAMYTLSSYGNRFLSGMSFTNAKDKVFVSRGAGNTNLPRVFSQPQIITFVLKSA